MSIVPHGRGLLEPHVVLHSRPALLLPSVPNNGATHQLSGKHVRLNTATKESQGL